MLLQDVEDLQPVHTIMAGLNAMHLNTTTEQTVTIETASE